MLGKMRAVLVFLLVITLFSGCKPKKINMNYIKIPDKINIIGDINNAEIIELTEEVKKLKEDGANLEAQQVVKDNIIKLVNAETINVTDREFINKLLGEIRKSEGNIGDLNKESKEMFQSRKYFSIDFSYSDFSVDTIEKIQGGYITNFYILNNGIVLIPGTSEDSSIIQVVLSNDTMEYINEYYNSNIIPQ